MLRNSTRMFGFEGTLVTNTEHTYCLFIVIGQYVFFMQLLSFITFGIRRHFLLDPHNETDASPSASSSLLHLHPHSSISKPTKLPL